MLARANVFAFCVFKLKNLNIMLNKINKKFIWAVMAIVMAAAFTSCDDDGPYYDYDLTGVWQSTGYDSFVYVFNPDGSGQAYYVGDPPSYFMDYDISGDLLSINWDYDGWTPEGYIQFTGPDSFILQPYDNPSYTGYFYRVD